MPLDACTLSALLRELKEAGEGAKIDKVQQPERDRILLSLRTPMGNRKLLLAAGTGNARVHFTEETMTNPAEPPMFCMLLRKHLLGGRIREITQPDWERMLVFSLESRDEMGDLSGKKLIVEMIGRSSNIILVGEDGRILDCHRRMDFGGDAERRMLPGMIYRFPPAQGKKQFFTSTREEREALLARAEEDSPEDWLMKTFSGLSPLLCRELSARCGGSMADLAPAMDALAETVEKREFVPTLVLTEGKPRDFSFLTVTQYGSQAENEVFGSFSALLDAFYSRRDRLEQRQRRSHELTKTVRTVRDRLQRKLAIQQEELMRTEDREEVRKRAELITANLYRLHKGDRELVCEDYYAEGCPTVHIPLDALKTPQQNAAALYREFSRQKAAREHLTGFIAQGEQQLTYLNSVLEEISLAETERDLSDIRRELAETGYLRRSTGTRQDKQKPQAPLRFVTEEGYEVLIGRSNIQNDELTHKLARRTDYWLHVQKIHGSHVILRCDGLEPPEESLRQAASLAVWFSQGREGGKVPVDYTMVRHVRKSPGGLPGMVLYTEYRTLMAEADEALVRRLKK